jgi:hypothetical protein
VDLIHLAQDRDKWQALMNIVVNLLYEALPRVRVVTIRRSLNWMIGFIDRLYTPLRTTRNYSAIAELHTLQFAVTHTLVF